VARDARETEAANSAQQAMGIHQVAMQR
jgi:hypothetical protein